MKNPKTGPATAMGQPKANPEANPVAGQDASTLLKNDHRSVKELFSKYENATSDTEKYEIAQKVCSELRIHTALEEEIFYPACREKAVESSLLDEAQVEHDSAKVLIQDLMSESANDEFYDAKMRVLSQYIKNHVAEEEKANDGIFARAKKSGVDMNAVGARLQTRKAQLLADSSLLSPPVPVSLHFQNAQQKESKDMPRYDNDRERDDRGRFTSDDGDRRYSRSSSGRSQRQREDEGRFMRDDDDNGGRYSGGGSSYRERDDRGRFTNDDDDDRRYSRSSSRRERDDRGRFTNDDEDDRRYSRGSSNRERDEEGRFLSDDDDDRRYSRGGRSSYDDDDNGSYGRSTRSSSSRRYRDDDDDERRSSSRGHGGWFGDPQGHSEASERGWESRSGSRRRDDDDDRRGSRSGGQRSRSRSDDDEGRGWHGDPRGHAEAARRGWRNRD